MFPSVRAQVSTKSMPLENYDDEIITISCFARIRGDAGISDYGATSRDMKSWRFVESLRCCQKVGTSQTDRAKDYDFVGCFQGALTYTSSFGAKDSFHASLLCTDWESPTCCTDLYYIRKLIYSQMRLHN